MDWNPLFLTFRLALITSILLFIISIPLAYMFAYKKFKAKVVLEAFLTTPLILPPTVLGFYLLVAFSPSYNLGQFFNQIGIDLVFNFNGLVVASMIYSLPFMVYPIKTGFQSIPQNYIHAARLMGKSDFSIIGKILLPNIKSSLLTGLVLTFAHTVGEFGVVLMIGGNIPDKTRVASIAIYNAVEGLDYQLANRYSILLVVISMAALIIIYSFTNNRSKSTLI